MYIETKIVRGTGTKMKKIMICECDACHTIFELTPFRKLIQESRRLTFCSKECVYESSKAGGKLRIKKDDALNEKFGSHPFANKDIQQQRREMWLKKYGVDHPWKSTEFREKNVKQRMLELYGVENPAKDKKFMKHVNYTESRRKQFETMKKNGQVPKQSKTETQFFDLLVNYFGFENVKRHVLINQWPIDFWIKHLDLFIQFDGVYWHGLDRPLGVLQESQNLRDAAILRKYHTDIQQNEWFKLNNKKLIRISDREFLRLFKIDPTLQGLLQTIG